MAVVCSGRNRPLGKRSVAGDAQRHAFVSAETRRKSSWDRVPPSGEHYLVDRFRPARAAPRVRRRWLRPPRWPPSRPASPTSRPNPRSLSAESGVNRLSRARGRGSSDGIPSIAFRHCIEKRESGLPAPAVLEDPRPGGRHRAACACYCPRSRSSSGTSVWNRRRTRTPGTRSYDCAHAAQVRGQQEHVRCNRGSVRSEFGWQPARRPPRRRLRRASQLGAPSHTWLTRSSGTRHGPVAFKAKTGSLVSSTSRCRGSASLIGHRPRTTPGPDVLSDRSPRDPARDPRPRADAIASRGDQGVTPFRRPAGDSARPASCHR